MDKERSEDLHPLDEDIEKKVKQMLDPSIPDAPEPAAAKPKKAITIQSVSEPAETPQTAPPTPVMQTPKTTPKRFKGTPPPSAKQPKKVIIPIDHHEETAKPKKTKTTKPAKTAKKITIADHNDTPETVAEKLDEAIAGLNSEAPKPVGQTKELTPEPTSAPELQEETAQISAEQPAIEQKTSHEPAVLESAAVSTIPEPEVPLTDPVVITDPETDKAVAEIVAAEGDELLEIEDAVRETEASDRELLQPRIKRAGFGKKLFKKMFLYGVPLGLAFCAVVPGSRYFTLNQFGVRASSSMTIIDDNTQQPLKNAQVSLGGVSAVTDKDGKVALAGLRLGKNQLVIKKTAFAPITRYITVGWGSNPLGRLGLSATGTRYGFVVQDFLSGKPIAKAVAAVKDTDGVSNDTGDIKLSLANPGDQPIEVTVQADGYRDEKITIQPSDTAGHIVKLVPARKHVYVSKKAGSLDVYSSFVDGKDEKLVLKGSGKERDDIVLVPHPRDTVVAFAATRAGQTDKAGAILTNLLIINLDGNTTENITAAEQVRIISWSGDRLVYVQTKIDAASDASDRYQLMSYNYKNGSRTELAKANFFNDVHGIGTTVYYAVSNAYQPGAASLRRVHADGTNNEVVLNQEVWNMFRASYDQLTLSVQQEWYQLRTSDKQPIKLNTAPAEQLSRVYVDSPDGSHSVWVDTRDGKGVLLSYDTTTKTERELKGIAGLNYPLRWLSDSVVVYRVRTAGETADYAISLDGGEAIKIYDVTNTIGLFRWLY